MFYYLLAYSLIITLILIFFSKDITFLGRGLFQDKNGNFSMTDQEKMLLGNSKLGWIYWPSRIKFRSFFWCRFIFNFFMALSNLSLLWSYSFIPVFLFIIYFIFSLYQYCTRIYKFFFIFIRLFFVNLFFLIKCI